MKKRLTLLLTLAMALGLCACGGADAPPHSGGWKPAGQAVTLTVAATPTPCAELLALVADTLADQGITLKITEYNNDADPNDAVERGEADANFFQHAPAMDQFNHENDGHLQAVAEILYVPMGIYPGRTAALDELPDGAVIAVPSDPANKARALLLLQAQGLIELDEAAGLHATPNDVTANPRKLRFQAAEASMLPQLTGDADLAVMPAGHAIQAGLSPRGDALATEAPAEMSRTYATILAVKEGDQDSRAIQALADALRSDAVKDYLQETYGGDVIALF